MPTAFGVYCINLHASMKTVYAEIEAILSSRHTTPCLTCSVHNNYKYPLQNVDELDADQAGIISRLKSWFIE